METKFNAAEFNALLNMSKKATKNCVVLITTNIEFFNGRAVIFDMKKHVYASLQGVSIEGAKTPVYVPFGTLQKLQGQIKNAAEITVKNDGENVDSKTYIYADGAEIYAGPYTMNDEPFQAYTMDPEKTVKAPENFFNDITGAIFCASTDRTKCGLTGVFYSFDGSAFCACDGHVLKGRKGSREGAIIDPAFVSFVNAGKLENGAFYFDPEYVKVHAGNIDVIAQNIEGPYPNYGAVIPQNFENVFNVNRADFLEALNIILPFSNTRTYKFLLQIHGEYICFSTFDIDRQVQKDVKIKALKTCDDGKYIAFDVRKMIQMINSIDAENVTVKFNNPIGATVIEGDGYNNLIMPCHWGVDGEGDPSIDYEKCAEVHAEKKTAKKAAKKAAAPVKTEAPAPVPAVDFEALKRDALEKVRAEIEAEKSRMIEAARVEVENMKKTALEKGENSFNELKEKAKSAAENYKKELQENAAAAIAAYKKNAMDAARAEITAVKNELEALKAQKENAARDAENYKKALLEKAQGDAFEAIQIYKAELMEKARRDALEYRAAMDRDAMEKAEAEKARAEKAAREIQEKREAEEIQKEIEATVENALHGGEKAPEAVQDNREALEAVELQKSIEAAVFDALEAEEPEAPVVVFNAAEKKPLEVRPGVFQKVMRAGIAGAWIAAAAILLGCMF